MSQEQFIEFVYAMDEASLNYLEIMDEISKYFRDSVATYMLYKAAVAYTQQLKSIYDICPSSIEERKDTLKEVVYFWVPEHLAEEGLFWADICK